jgi:hypothetical protein
LAVLFLLALALMGWQAWRLEPVLLPPFEVATKPGERILPVAVPSWKAAPELPATPRERLAWLRQRSVAWPGAPAPLAGVPGDCQLFVRASAQHWVARPASPAQLAFWRGGQPAPLAPWQAGAFSAAAFLDDDDGDGDPLDAGELAGPGAPGAEVECFCGAELIAPEEADS